MKKILKKNQVIVYVIALMLVTAGYLNYTSSTAKEVSSQTEMEIADTGDATLVSSNDVKVENNVETKAEENMTNNSTNTSNITNNQTNSISTETSATASEYFTKSKLERDTMYSQMIESYNNILNSSNSTETQKQSATEEITKINNIKNSIMICENLISTKGFNNSVVFINGESVSVIVDKGGEKLKQEEVAQIQNIVARETKVKVENIHISDK